MNSLKIKNIIISAIVISALSLTGCGKNGEQKEEKKETSKNENISISKNAIKEIDLKTEVVKMLPFEGNVAIPATVLTNQDAEALVGSLVQGRIHKVYVKAGDYVKAGQLLMDIEGLEIGQIKADYLTDKASLEVAKANYERLKSLNEQKIGSQKSLIEAEAEYKKALAEFMAEDRKIHSIGMTDDEITGENQKKGNDHTPGLLHVKSPINGLVVERNVVIGQMVEATTNAFKIINTSDIWIDGKASEKDIKLISEKSSARFISSVYPDESFSGRINFVNPVIDEKTRTFTIRCDFKNLNNKLKPQMFGELLIPAAKNSKAILIPAESVIKIDNNDCVFVVVSDTVFSKRIVKTGSVENDRIEIKEGLKEGEKIVSKGAFYIKSEMLKDELGGEE